MLDALTQRLSSVVKTLRGHSRLTEDNVQEMLREVRLALLDADAGVPVVKDFTAKVKEKPSLADFFDFKKYPGKRLMRKDSQAMYELALMADGVPKDKLYPLDAPRALKKIMAIKKDLLFWNSGAESQTLLRDANGWHVATIMPVADTNFK